MALDVLQHASFAGPAFPEPFVRFELEKELNRLKLLSRATGAESRELQETWEVYRRRLRELIARGGPLRVRHHVLEPLVARLGYARLEASPEVETREGREDGGHLMVSSEGRSLRVWATSLDEDLDAPSRRGRAYRFSHTRIAQRVLLAAGERVGLLTNGVELRLLISDPARPDSHLGIPIDPHWERSREVPDTYRLLIALASPVGVQAIPELVDKARLQQTRVTTELRAQARQAIERFVQGVLDHPENREQLAAFTDKERLARLLWREGLITIYRLLFILKLEASDDPARSFSFASTSLWRNSFSPGVALARYARSVLDQGAETGRLLEDGLRTLFRMFEQGLQCSELHIAPLGGALFGADATPLLSNLRWGEHSVAHLLDRLLWTPRRRGAASRERVHYGPLDVEDLGRVYEALLELEPGIAPEPMCRLRRQKLEVVVPMAQGERYRPAAVAQDAAMEDSESEDEAFTEDEEESPTRGKKTRVAWIEEIRPGRFYLRVSLGRKASGSYYTPHAFVRFLVQETLGPQVADRSPEDDPHPGEILKCKILDPAMGSGHFLVEACRFLGEKLYEACRLCDERALEAERRAEQARTTAEREAALAEVDGYRQRIIDLPDPDDEIEAYKRYVLSSLPNVNKSAHGRSSGEVTDIWQCFAERSRGFLNRNGMLGLVLPSAFHANEGATGIRRLYLDQMALRCCYSFENRRKLFEIDSRFKFATVVASRTGPTTEFPCAFYLHDDEWLFGERGNRELRYTLDFVRRTGGDHLTLLELRSTEDVQIVAKAYAESRTFGSFFVEANIRTGEELHMSKSAHLFTPTAELLPKGDDPRQPDVLRRLFSEGYFVLHEGKTFHQYTDLWDERPRYLVQYDQLRGKANLLEASRYFRLTYRAIASSTNERTSIFCLLPAGCTVGNSAPCEKSPGKRTTADALCIISIANAFVFDWVLRQKNAANVNFFIISSCPVPPYSSSVYVFFVYSALRLTCNHAGYEPLWREQLGDTWREPKTPFTWPVLEGDDECWAVRAAIDAAVADAYGLSREQYAHVLSTFSHRSYPKAPELCLARFNELKAIGLEAFTRKYDPYWDIPLNENLPEPVIDLPIGEAAPADNGRTTAQEDQLSLLAAESGVRWNPSPTPRIPASRSASSHRTAAATADDDTYDLLKLLLEEQGVITSADVQDLTGLDAAGVRQLLKRLVDDGIAVQEGQRRGTKYHYAGPGHANEGAIC